MAVRSSAPVHLLRKRIALVFWVLVLCYLALVARLLWLQAHEGPKLRAEAAALRQQKIPLRAHRGSIVDRDGRPLAASLYVGTVGFDPAAAQFDAKNAKQQQKLAETLTRSVTRAAALLNLPEAQLRTTVEQACLHFDPNHPVRFVPIKREVTLDVAQQIRDARPPLLGFGVQDGSHRVYASGSDTVQVVGFVGATGLGVAGLERAGHLWLDGRSGYALAELDNRKREIPDTQRKLVPAQDGLDVQTTLDANAQHIAMQEAQRVMEKFHPKGVSVVVVEPNTGDILALVSAPTFDPNPGQRHTFQPEALAERCTTRLYEPGSTLKGLTIAAALDDGVIGLNDRFYCGGTLTVGKKLIHCVLHGAAERNGHGSETAEDIMRHSCNVGAAEVGLKLGAARLYEAERKFGLLSLQGVGLPAEQYGRLSLDKTENVNSAAKVARVAFGHSITTTPLHVAMAYAALVNGGILMQPRLVSAVKDGTGKAQKTWEPRPVRRVISARTSAEMGAMLRAVVTNGTGRVVALPGYVIGGKTGTARKYGKKAYVSSFIGYLPASPNVKPRAVVLVVVDEPQGAYYGAEVAAPAFQAIARRLMSYWHVPEDDPQSVQARAAAESLRRAGQAPLLAALKANKDYD